MKTLNNNQNGISWGRSMEWLIVLGAIFFSGLIVQFPRIFNLDPEVFFPRNISLIVFPMLTIYVSWRNNLSFNNWILPVIVFIISTIFINLLPGNDTIDVFVLSCIHLPLFLWSTYGFAFMGKNSKGSNARIDFLRYNGDLIVMTALIVISGFLFTAVTIGLFELIDLNIEEFYMNNIASWGIAGVPILASFLVLNNPSLAGKISPVIAKIFTPFVFFTLLIFSIAITVSNKNIYSDRDFLLIFKIILIAVMAIILFSLGESTKSSENRFQIILLFLLSLISVLDNVFALSAIGFRLFEFGITPNRMAVLGSNLLILSHLIIVSRQILLVLKGSSSIKSIEKRIGGYLPLYTIWAMIVTFFFPFLF